MREHRLHNEKKQLEILLQKKLSEKSEFISEVCKLQTNIENVEFELSKMNDLKLPVITKVSPFNRRNSSSSGHNLNFKRRNSKTDDKFELETKQQQIVFRRLQLIDEKTNLLENLKLEKKEKKFSLHKSEVELKKLKIDLKVIKNKLLTHYYDVLKVGLDTRKEGLTWVIKEIYLLKGGLKESHMPEFLDTEGIVYLFNITKYNLDLYKILQEKQNLKSEVQSKKETGVIVINPMIKLFNTSITNRHDTINSLDSQNNNNKNMNPFNTSISSPNSNKTLKLNTLTPAKTNTLNHSQSSKLNINIRRVSQFFDNKVTLNGDTQKIIENISILEKKESSLKEEIKKLKEREMKRIFKEFVKNNYDRRFNCEKKTVIAALIGEENTPVELVRQYRQQKIYFQELEMCRNFLPNKLYHADG